MGRKNGRRHAPQRSRLVANRELRQAINGEAPQAFGIKRFLDHDSAQNLLFPLDLITKDHAWPEGVVARESLQVTLLHRKKVFDQMRRGLVFGHALSLASAEILHGLQEEAPRHIHCKLGKAALFQNNHFGLRIISNELELEREVVLDAMAGIGLKGAKREVPPLHITVADARLGLNKYERLDTIEMINTMIPEGQEIMLNQLQFYSQPRRQAA